MIVSEENLQSPSQDVDKVSDIDATTNPNQSAEFIISEKGSENDQPSNANTSITEEPTENKENLNEWVDVLGSGHLKKKVVVAGTDKRRPKGGDNVTINLIGRLENSDEIFEQKKDFEVTVGDFEVIQGIDYVLPLMDIGETCEIITTSRFGYGDLGDPSINVPPKASLSYTVSLSDIKEEEFIHEIDAERRITIGIAKKERGNWWFQRKEYQIAIQCYRKALTYLDPDSASEEVNEKICDARLKTFNNLTIAQLNIEAYDAALTSVNQVLGREPQNIKAIFRKVKILRAQGELDEAMKVCKEGLAIKPDSAALQEALTAIMETRKKSLASQKVLYRKMFQNSEKGSEAESKNGKNMTFVWKWFGLITIAVGVISAVAIKYRS